MSEYEAAKQKFEDVMGNSILKKHKLISVFDDDDIEAVFDEFEKTAANGSVSKDDFKRIFGLLFDDPEDENAFVLLDNQLLLDRIFVYCDTDKNGSIDLAEFCDGICLMFSGEPESAVKCFFFLLIEFLVRYTVFFIDNSGEVTRNNVYTVLKVFFLCFDLSR